MSIFRRSSVRYGRTPEPETPYQRAAQVWDERIGSARVQARNWRYMAFGHSCPVLRTRRTRRRPRLAINAWHRRPLGCPSR